MASKSVTRAEQAYAKIRADILSGRVQPGAKLPFAELSARYEASISVMREGLSRLAEQGLVIAEPQQGFRVASISITDLEDLTIARCEVESIALRYSIECGDLAWESRVVAVHHSLERTPGWVGDDLRSINEEWAALHGDYHRTLLSGCPSTRLTAVAMSLRDSAELYRRWSQPGGASGSRDVAKEHRELTQAALDRDSDAAVALLTSHLVLTSRLLADRASSEGLTGMQRFDTSIGSHAQGKLRPSSGSL